MQNNGQVVNLQDYMRNYGPRLQSLLTAGNPTTTAPVIGTASALGRPQASYDQNGDPSGLFPPEPTGSAMPEEGAFPPRDAGPLPPTAEGPPIPETSALAAPGAAPAAASGGGSMLAEDVPPTPAEMRESALARPGYPEEKRATRGAPMLEEVKPQDSEGQDFRKLWEKTPEDERKEFADKLEGDLKKGNQTIDDAFNEMTQQLGERPTGRLRDLSREDKAMMLMEFGLQLMANSSAQAYGQDLGGAIGAAGLSALGGHNQRTANAQAAWDEETRGIARSRAKAKVDLAQQSTLEAARDEREYQRDRRREAREDSQIADTVITPDDKVVGITRGGQSRLLTLEGDGSAVKAKPKPPPAGRSGGSGRPTESQARYDRYMEINGKDTNGQPLTGEDLRRVQQEALDYSADPKGSALSDTERRALAERSADDFMRANPDLFRDKTPEQTAAFRNQLADDRYRRLQKQESPSSSKSKKTVPARPARGGRQAPSGAIEALRKEPQRAAEFLQHYGYLPAEFHQYLK